MTDDNSPDNLRKFLESDDPAMVMMGLEMAKGVGLDERLSNLVLGLSYFELNEQVNLAARSLLDLFSINAEEGSFVAACQEVLLPKIQRPNEDGEAPNEELETEFSNIFKGLSPDLKIRAAGFIVETMVENAVSVIEQRENDSLDESDVSWIASLNCATIMNCSELSDEQSYPAFDEALMKSIVSIVEYGTCVLPYGWQDTVYSECVWILASKG